MRNRRGVAMLTALWLVVAIAAVVLEFSLEAKERRQLGLDAAERGVGQAAASGALATVLARLDNALRTAPTGRGTANLRASDPWLGVDSLYSGQYAVDSANVQVVAHDLGTQLNINSLSEAELRTFFNFVLNDVETADKLAQSIMDWRDADDLPRGRGGEKDDYLKANLLTLPQNGPFREVEDLLSVMNMTPDIYARIKPYFTTRGDNFINLNSAPAPVLRVLPGMTDALLGQIIAARTGGRRITSVEEVMQSTSSRSTERTVAQMQSSRLAITAMSRRATVDVRQVEVTLTARATPQAQPVRLIAIIERSGPGLATLELKQW